MVLNGRAGDFNISNDTRDPDPRQGAGTQLPAEPDARNLRAGRTDILGLMAPTLRNHFFGEMAETFEALARAERKLALISVTQYERAEELSAMRYFLSQQVDCVRGQPDGDRGSVGAGCQWRRAADLHRRRGQRSQHRQHRQLRRGAGACSCRHRLDGARGTGRPHLLFRRHGQPQGDLAATGGLQGGARRGRPRRSPTIR